MKSVNGQLLEQVNHLIAEAQNIIDSAITEDVEVLNLAHSFQRRDRYSPKETKKEKVYDWARIIALEASVKTFMLRLHPDPEHPRNQILVTRSKVKPLSYLRNIVAILESTKTDIEKGWVVSFSELVSAEIFSDSLDAAKHLLDSGYKDAAAVLIGSTLEGHLRELAKRNGIETVNDKEKLLSGGALNQALTTSKVYDASKNKAVTLYLDTRNDAAHGHYNKYTAPDVQQMYFGVVLFISQT